MARSIFSEITRKHSTTFYYSSLFFPKSIRDDVHVLYSFLRTADDLVDVEKNKEKFFTFKDEVYKSISNGSYASRNIIIKSFAEIFRKYGFDREYLDSFFESLEFDFKKPLQIMSYKELDRYVYGVAGVVGLMMARIMELPRSSFSPAREFGEVMQLINIIRDIKEDYRNGRVYIPKEDLKKYHLPDIMIFDSRKNYCRLIRFEISRVLRKLKGLSEEFKKIPLRYRRPVEISRDVYKSIANKIYENPELTLTTRVSVSKPELYFLIAKNLFY